MPGQRARVGDSAGATSESARLGTPRSHLKYSSSIQASGFEHTNLLELIAWIFGWVFSGFSGFPGGLFLGQLMHRY